MYHSRRFLFSFCSTSMAIIHLGTLNPSPTFAQTQVKSWTPNNQTLAGKPKDSWDWFGPRPREKTGGSRDGSLCLFTPAIRREEDKKDKPEKFWSKTPLFSWKPASGNREIIWIEVYDDSTDSKLWEALAEGKSAVRYAGQPLIPGKAYRIMFFNRTGKLNRDASDDPKFILLAESERQPITQALQAMDGKGKSTRLGEEERAMRKAKILYNKNLWSDAFDVAVSVKKPSQELLTQIQTLYQEICPNKGVDGL